MRCHSEQTNANCHELFDSKYGSGKSLHYNFHYAGYCKSSRDGTRHKLVKWCLVRFIVQDNPIQPSYVDRKLCFEFDSYRC